MLLLPHSPSTPENTYINNFLLFSGIPLLPRHPDSSGGVSKTKSQDQTEPVKVMSNQISCLSLCSVHSFFFFFFFSVFLKVYNRFCYFRISSYLLIKDCHRYYIPCYLCLLLWFQVVLPQKILFLVDELKICRSS